MDQTKLDINKLYDVVLRTLQKLEVPTVKESTASIDAPTLEVWMDAIPNSLIWKSEKSIEKVWAKVHWDHDRFSQFGDEDWSHRNEEE
jgi:hypothetical protein